MHRDSYLTFLTLLAFAAGCGSEIKGGPQSSSAHEERAPVESAGDASIVSPAAKADLGGWVPPCTGVRCTDHASCDPATGLCDCDDGYHHEDDKCISNGEIGCCGAKCATCKAPPHGSATCDGTACRFACKSGYHKSGSLCAPNNTVQCCGAKCATCKAPSHADATCDGTACGFACQSGYHKSGSLCAPNNTVQCCGAKCATCKAPSHADATCDGTACGFACQSGYHKSGSLCAPNNTVQCCGAKCATCKAPSHADATCDGTACGFACQSGYHKSGSVCAPNNTVQCCSKSCKKCVAPTPGAVSCDGVSCVVSCQSGFEPGAGCTMSDLAVPAIRPPGTPEYADVSVRYGWIRANAFPTIEDAKQAISAYHATRVDWFYAGGSHGTPVSVKGREFVNWCHANGMKIGGAFNAKTTRADWKVVPGPRDRMIGDPSIAAYRDAAVGWAVAQIDAGVDAIVFDDFFFYSDAHKDLYNSGVIARIKRARPGFPIAGNYGHTIGTRYVKNYAFDYHYSDISFEARPSEWWKESRAHRRLNSAIITHPNLRLSRWRYRVQIALGYANGGHVIAPWDEYIHNGDRRFAPAGEYADMYAFARCLGQNGFLNGYEDVAVGGYELTEDRHPVKLLGYVAGNPKLSLFARAKPRQKNASIIVHLVKWTGTGRTTFRLRTEAFFGGRALRLRLWTRQPYNAQRHATAESTGDFQPLKWERTADMNVRLEGPWTIVDIPELHPWGVLIVDPA